MIDRFRNHNLDRSNFVRPGLPDPGQDGDLAIPSERNSGLLNLLRGSFAIAWVGILGWLTVRFAGQAVLPMYDFLEYWAAGRLQLTGHNPYAPDQLLALQQSIGWPYDGPLMMWNPPWTLSFVMPLGLLNFHLSRVLWLWIGLTIVLLCVEGAWRWYGGTSRQRWLAYLVGFTFLPTLMALYLGQINLLILAGVVGFLYFERRQQWWLAGAATVLIAIKPPLLYLFWIALLLWALDRRCWAVLLGGGGAGLLITAIPLLFNPAVLNQYAFTVVNHPPTYWMTPTFGTLLRMLFGWEKAWLQFVPAALGVLWFLFYWRQHRRTWVWIEQMPVLLLVSLVTTSYRWTHDQVVLLPAVIQATVWLTHSRQRWMMGLVLILYLAINILPLTPIQPVGDVWRVWTAPALLFLYLGLRRQIHREVAGSLPWAWTS